MRRGIAFLISIKKNENKLSASTTPHNPGLRGNIFLLIEKGLRGIHAMNIVYKGSSDSTAGVKYNPFEVGTIEAKFHALDSMPRRSSSYLPPKKHHLSRRGKHSSVKRTCPFDIQIS